MGGEAVSEPITIVNQAPPGHVFAPDAFAREVGKKLTVHDGDTRVGDGVVQSAVVSDDGTSVTLTIVVEPVVIRSMTLGGVQLRDEPEPQPEAEPQPRRTVFGSGDAEPAGARKMDDYEKDEWVKVGDLWECRGLAPRKFAQVVNTWGPVKITEWDD
jgi:hypothetical protein